MTATTTKKIKQLRASSQTIQEWAKTGGKRADKCHNSQKRSENPFYAFQVPRALGRCSAVGRCSVPRVFVFRAAWCFERFRTVFESFQIVFEAFRNIFSTPLSKNLNLNWPGLGPSRADRRANSSRPDPALADWNLNFWLEKSKRQRKR